METTKIKQATEKVRPFLPTIALLALCLITPKSYLTRGDIPAAFLFHFTHASLFHLLANFYVIARFRPRWANLPTAYFSATCAALVPITATPLPTVGISGMIFAMLARRDAILRTTNWRLLGLNFLFALLHCYNWRIHLLSYLISLVLWKIYLNLAKHSR